MLGYWQGSLSHCTRCAENFYQSRLVEGLLHLVMQLPSTWESVACNRTFLSGRNFIFLHKRVRLDICCVFYAQDHYDWGLRAIKSVLVVAGSLKRGDPGRPEDQVGDLCLLRD